MKKLYTPLLLVLCMIHQASLAQVSPAPLIDSVKPLAAKAGTTVKLFGKHFGNTPAANIVWFGGMKATVTAAYPDSLKVTVPAGASYGAISVSTNGMVATSKLPFLPTYTGFDTLNATALSTSAELSAGWQPTWFTHADLDGDGKIDLVAVNSAANSVAVLRNISQGNEQAFDVNSYTNVGYFCSSVTAGDIDGDGKPDLVLTAGGDNKVIVMRNTSNVGAISFAPARVFNTGENPRQAAIGDMNGDGRPDLVTANYLGKSVSVLRNFGTIGFVQMSEKEDFSMGALHPTSLTLTDLNGDNLPDIVFVAKDSLGADSLSYSLNVPYDGVNVSLRVSAQLGAVEHVMFVTAADIDLDGRDDLLVTTENPGYIAVFRNTTINKVVSFAPKVQLPASTEAARVAVGDIDGDGKPDLAITIKSANTVAVYRNRSTPGIINFNQRIDFNAGYTPTDLVIADIDLDGKPDIAVTNQVGSKVVILRNFMGEPVINSFSPVTGNRHTVVTIKGIRLTGVTAVSFGGVAAQAFTIVNESTITATVGEGGTGNVRVGNPMSSDEKPFFIYGDRPSITALTPVSGAAGSSVVIAGKNFSVHADSNIVFFGGGRAMVTSASATSLTVIVPTTASYAPVTVTVRHHTAYSSVPFLVAFPGIAPLADTSFSAPASYGAGGRPRGVALADLDGDGRTDVALVDNTGKKLSVLHNSGAPGTWAFDQRLDIAAGSNPFMVAAGDLDGDGRPDLVVADLEGSRILVYKNQSAPGHLSFAPFRQFITGESPIDLAIRDMNNDGKPDVITVNSNGHSISVLQNLSTAEQVLFAAKTDFATGLWPHAISIDDLNGDHKPDIVVANHDGESVSVLRNNGTGGAISFAAPVDHPVGGHVVAVVTTDLDGDGRIDMVASSQTGLKVVVYKNESTGDSIIFKQKTSIPTAEQPVYVAAADLNGDGKPDLVISESMNYLSRYENQSTADSIGWGPRMAMYLESFPQTLAIADLTGDGKPDIVATRPLAGMLSILANKGSNAWIVGTGSNAVTGAVNNRVFFDTMVTTYQGVPYVQRHYELNPVNDAATATGTITFFFTQADFDRYNLHAAPGEPLPSGPTDLAHTANLRLYQYQGYSHTGLPGSYETAGKEIDPLDDNIVWNAVKARWEVTVDVNGFGGFFVTTTGNSLITQLPVAPVIAGLAASYCSSWGLQTAKLTNTPHWAEGIRVTATIDGKPLAIVQDSLCRFNPDTLAGGSHNLKITYTNAAGAKVAGRTFEVIKAVTPVVHVTADITHVISLASEVKITASHKEGGATPLYTFARDKAFTSLWQTEGAAAVLTINPSSLAVGDNKIFVRLKSSVACYVSQTAIDSIVISRDAATAILDVANPGAVIRLYPNPFGGKINIDGLSSGKAYQLVLYDNRGQAIYRIEAKNRTLIEIPAAGLKPGLYWISIYDSKRKLIGTERVVKY